MVFRSYFLLWGINIASGGIYRRTKLSEALNKNQVSGYHE
jgi:hypothetical protein